VTNLPSNLAALYCAIPRSREQATSMLALAQLLGCFEREIREQIKELRETYGLPVMALPTRNGVWVTDDPADLDALIACQTSRARSIEESIRALKRVRDQMTYKPALF